jgi:SAM-dependent methyltransferase
LDVFSDSIPRLRYLASRAKKLAQSRDPVALNIGVGGGWLEDHLIRVGWTVRSLDPNESVMARLKEKGIIGNVGDVEALPYRDRVFDVVFCSEILEHLSRNQMERGLKEIFRVLRPGGYLLGTVPSQENLDDNEVICPNCGQIFHRWGHQQHFGQTNLSNIFPAGVKRTVVVPRLFISWRGMNLKRKIAAFMKLLLFYLGSHGSNETLYFQVKK